MFFFQKFSTQNQKNFVVINCKSLIYSAPGNDKNVIEKLSVCLWKKQQ